MHLQNQGKDLVKKREECCCPPIHAAANLRDPRLKGRGVSDEKTAAAFDWMTKDAALFGLEVGKGLSKVAGYGPSSGIWARNAPGFCKTHPSCNTVARSLRHTTSDTARISLTADSASSAARERIWSTSGNIHTKSRNKLTHERGEKLVSIRANLPFLEVHEKNDKEEEEEETENDGSSSENEIE